MNKHVPDLRADVESKAPVVGTVIDNGHELLLVPEAELKTVDGMTEKLAKPESEDWRDFDWANDEAVALRSQPMTAIYFNPDGSLVIRQERAWDQEEDTFIVITASNMDTFLERLTDACGIPSVGGPQPKPAPGGR